jgi:hypothetical protein
MNQLSGWSASISWGKLELASSSLINDGVLTHILIPECMSPDNDGLDPAWDDSWDI